VGRRRRCDRNSGGLALIAGFFTRGAAALSFVLFTATLFGLPGRPRPRPRRAVRNGVGRLHARVRPALVRPAWSVVPRLTTTRRSSRPTEVEGGDRSGASTTESQARTAGSPSGRDGRCSAITKRGSLLAPVMADWTEKYRRARLSEVRTGATRIRDAFAQTGRARGTITTRRRPPRSRASGTPRSAPTTHRANAQRHRETVGLNASDQRPPPIHRGFANIHGNDDAGAARARRHGASS